MRRSFEFPRNGGNGWDSTSNDFHAHVSRVSRTPSVLNDVPQYPNVHMLFNKNAKREGGHGTKQKPHHANKHPQFIEKVEVINSKEETGNNRESKESQVVDENINSRADGFIKSKHKAFELCRWETFKVH